MALLEIKNLKLDFITSGPSVRVLDGVSFSLDAGETLCLVGESGCGKSVTALSLTKLLPTPPACYLAGAVLLNGRDVLRMSATELCEIRGGLVSYVFQQPSVSLNPVMRVGSQIRETLKLHRPHEANDAEVVRLLKLVGIPAPEMRLNDYPFRLSGGTQQRVMLAMALAAKPKLLVADEPTTALDVTLQAEMLELLLNLQRQLGMAILLISHNLGLVGDMGGGVAVMYSGQIVEMAPARELIERPLHPYTRALLDSVPRLNERAHRLVGIPGAVPALTDLPAGCRFAPRCTFARPECGRSMPELAQAETGRWVRCPYWNSLSSRPDSTLGSRLSR